MMKVNDDTANLEKDGVWNIHGDNDAVLPQVCNTLLFFILPKQLEESASVI